MYSANGVYYSNEHSISFGMLETKTSGGETYEDFKVTADTWNTWHLIPSTRPTVEPPTAVTKFVEIPGLDGMLDLTDYLIGRPAYGQRQGSFSFYIDHNQEYWESIRESMVRILHGKRLKMRLKDDPMYYYEGRFTVGPLASGASYSTISISYQLEPYKFRINPEGSSPVIWDSFCFDKDYDYSAVMTPITVSDNETKNFVVHAGDYSFTPVATWVSGTITVKFGSNPAVTLNSTGTAALGPSVSGNNTLKVTGTGSMTILWRGGSL